MFIAKENIYDLALSKNGLPRDLAKKLLIDEKINLLELVQVAGDIREKFFGKKIKVHQINNIQNGLCPEDCGYCGQVKRF